MRTPSAASVELTDEPSWPAAEGPFVFLLDASSMIERQILEGWVERHRTAEMASFYAGVPASRRRRTRSRISPKLVARLEQDDDPLCIPLRVVWLARERDGKRRVTLRDVLVFGDPRDPNRIRQRLILAAQKDRCRIVMGEPARKSDLADRWRDPEGRGPADGTTLAEFTALQAWLALERAERGLRGSRYKVPKFLSESLFASRTFQQGIARIALAEEKPLGRVQQRAHRYLKEIAATHSPYVIDVVTGITGWLISMAYQGLNYSEDDLRSLYKLGHEHPLVFLPSHKSNFDHLVLQFLLYENELPPNHTAGGINMNFFPIGMLLRRSGIFFIRREFKGNDLYKYVLRRYLDYLLEKRFPLEWYIEGGRSRTGKLREPRLGLLAYVVEAYTQGLVEDIVLVPVSIAYDQISDLGAYTAEQRGGSKERESFGWALRFIRNLRHRYGSIHVRFGAAISVAGEIPTATDLGSEEGRLAVPKLAFKVSTHINDATPITPISLVTLALLSKQGIGVTVGETITTLQPFLDYVERRGLPTTESLVLDTPERMTTALDELALNGIISRNEGLTDVVYLIGYEQHLAAAYYRNTIIHFFVTGSIVELALAGMLGSATSGLDDFVARAFALRDLLKFEFFFEEREPFREALFNELDLAGPDVRTLVDNGGIEAALTSFTPIMSPAVLRPFLEAYQIVADVIATADPGEELAADEIKRRALALGRQYTLQGVTKTAEAVSTALFTSAIHLADNRGLLSGLPEAAASRRAFSEQTRQVIADLDRVHDLEAGPPPGGLKNPLDHTK